MTQLSEIMDLAQLQQHLEQGNVRTQTHNWLPYTVYDYTEKCAFDREWDDVTLQCRGLLVSNSGEVIARPFIKFFNRGEQDAPMFPPNTMVEVTDKLDGSCGIYYRTPDGDGRIATRGSFHSEQAEEATKMLHEKYPDFDPPRRLTVIFEIIYPENRIVVDYGEMRDLVLLGSVGIDTGTTLGPEIAAKVSGWTGPLAETFEYNTLAKALAAPNREGREGLVIRSLEHDVRIKYKQDDYVYLHKIVTGLNARKVWEHLKLGRDLDDLIKPLPDEFHDWVRNIATSLQTEVDQRAGLLKDAYKGVLSNLSEGWTSKDFAMLVLGHPWTKENSWALFSLRDSKDIYPKLWEMVKPEAYVTPAKDKS